MADKIIIGEERLPTLEVLGKEYPYDVTSASTMEELERITGGIDPKGTNSGKVIELCKTFTTLLFCHNTEPAERIAEVYKDSAMLWVDVVVQLSQYITSPKLTNFMRRVTNLKAAAGNGK